MACFDCGCYEPTNDHGEKGHLVLDDFAEAAEASHITLDEVMTNIMATYDKLTEADDETDTD